MALNCRLYFSDIYFNTFLLNIETMSETLQSIKRQRRLKYGKHEGA